MIQLLNVTINSVKSNYLIKNIEQVYLLGTIYSDNSYNNILVLSQVHFTSPGGPIASAIVNNTNI